MDREIHVEKQVIWNVVITDEFGRKEWPHNSEEEAIKRCNRMFDKGLVTERGKDSL